MKIARGIAGLYFSFTIFYTVYFAQNVTVYGHRGARGLAPENTLPAYQVALMQGVDCVDLDVAMTKDGVIVVQHDLTLNPNITRDKRGHWLKKSNLVVKNLTLQTIKTYDVGQIKPNTDYAQLFPLQTSLNNTSIPTLQEVIAYVKQNAGKDVGFQIEIKTDPTAPNLSVPPKKIVMALDQIIRKEGISHRTKIQAYDWQCLLLMQKINPLVETAYITDTDLEKTMRELPQIASVWLAGKRLKNYHNSIPEMIKSLGGTWWDAQDIQLTTEQIEHAHLIGLKVAAWSWPERTGLDVDIPLIKKLALYVFQGLTRLTIEPTTPTKLSLFF